MIISDADLISRIVQKDKTSFEYLYKNYYKKLYLLGYQYMRNQEQAEEIVQDVFINVWNNAAGLQIRQSLGAYLSRCIINTSLNLIKKEKRWSAHLERYHYTLDDTEEPDDYAQLLEDKLVRLEQAIEMLPPQCKKVLMMSKFEHSKQQEIADKLNISIKTVKNHLTLGYDKIRIMMQQQQPLLIAVIIFQYLGLGLMIHHIVI